MTVSVRPWCQYFIDAEIMKDDSVFRFSGIYGEPKVDERKKTWDALHYLARQDNLPWLCASDFNEVLFQSEQKGGNPRRHAQKEGFRDALAECNLADMGFSGYPFTSDNK